MEKKLIFEKLKSENELKTKWLSLIAHDFKGMFHNIVYLLNAYEKKRYSSGAVFNHAPRNKANSREELKNT